MRSRSSIPTAGTAAATRRRHYPAVGLAFALVTAIAVWTHVCGRAAAAVDFGNSAVGSLPVGRAYFAFAEVAASANPLIPDGVYILGGATATSPATPTFLRSVDGGVSWTQLPDFPVDTMGGSMWFFGGNLLATVGSSTGTYGSMATGSTIVNKWDGTSWTSSYSSLASSGRFFATAGYFAGTIIFGSGQTRNGGAGAMYASSNGLTWGGAVTAFSRMQHCTFNFGGYYYVAGGLKGSGAPPPTVANDVAGTTDPSVATGWTTYNANWAARIHLGCAVYGSTVYIMGGNSGTASPTYYHDVWSTTTPNSATWTLVTNTAPWTARTAIAVSAGAGRFIVIGGDTGSSSFVSDVWSFSAHDCASNPCGANGVCTEGAAGYTCDCVPGFMGGNCQTNINECASAPCAAGGTCTDLVASFTCLCAGGFSGARCQTDINECASSPCLAANAVCQDGANGYTCLCAPGYVGANCQTDVNECASQPCRNGATCVDGANQYSCTCVPGYSGVNCQTNIDECASNPCVFGSCADLVNRFNCTCNSGFTGVMCQTDINECATANGGCAVPLSSCVNTAGSFVCSPYVVPGSLKPLQAVNSSVPGNFVLANTLAGQAISFNVSAGNSDIQTLNFTFGPIEAPATYRCIVTLVPPISNVNQLVRCVLPLAAGTKLRVAIVTGLDSVVAAVSNDTFGYLPPTIRGNTLRSNSSGFFPSTSLTPSTSIGITIQFDGTNFVPSPQATTIFYGSIANPKLFECVYSPARSTYTTLSCTTADYSQGSNLRFAVYSGNHLPVFGTDVMNYQQIPVIISVAGCSNVGNATIDCPTEGGADMVLTGSDFSISSTILVGGSQCSPLIFVSSSNVRCTLPPGTGTGISVTVNAGGQLSAPKNFVSYAVPTIYGISSGACAPNTVASRVTGCPRTGNIRVTITGVNFGNPPPAVLIGSTVCAAITAAGDFPQRSVSCKIPAGNTIDRPVLMLQSGGGISVSNATLSYAQCPVGSSENGFGCLPCPLSLVASSEGSQSCQPCPAGQVSGPAPSSTCTPCAAGMIAGSGSVVCTNCTAGRFVTLPGQATCNPCVPGEYTTRNGSTSCVECPPGTSQSQYGQTSCRVCDPGRYQPIEGSSDCVDCPVGSYSAEFNATTCFACPPGMVQPDSGQLECTNCTIGQIASVSGLGFCVGCSSGSHAPFEGMTECVPCRIGTSQREIGAFDCDPCAAGQYNDNPNAAACKACAPGTFTNYTEATVCDVCELGYFQSSSGQTACVACPIGSFTLATGQPACRECGVGTYTAVTATVQCASCDVGFYQPTTNGTACLACGPGKFSISTGAIECGACGAGTFSDETGAPDCAECPAGRFQSSDSKTACVDCAVGQFSAARQSSCTVCNAGQINPHTGRSSCTVCIASKPNAERTRCACDAGYFDDAPAGSENPQCRTCGVGMVCRDSGLTILTLQAMNGWWRSDNQSLDFLQCLQISNCVDGHCGPNRVGPLCAACADGFQATSQGSDCEACPSQSTALNGTIGFTFLLVAALAIVFIGVWHSDGTSSEVLKRKKNAAFTKVRHWTAEDTVKPSFTYNLKILLSYFQIATSLLSFVEIPWPTYFQEFINYFDFVNLDFIPWSSVQCVASLTFYDRLIIVALLPPVVIAFVAGVPFLILSLCNKFDFADADHSRDLRVMSRQKILKLLVFALFLMYPALSARVLSYFICRTVNGTDYLVADFALKCYDSLWYRYLALGVICLLAYPIGIPMFLLWLLYRNRFKLRDPATIVALGIMYDSYDIRYWFFEIVDMAEKLFLTSLLGFFSPSIQCPVGCFVVLVYLSTQYVLSPYVRRIDDRFCLITQVHLFLILLIGYTLQQITFETGSLVDILASILMLGVLALLVTVLVIHLIIFVRTFVRTRQRNRAFKEDAELNPTTDLILNPLSDAVMDAKAATSADRHQHKGRSAKGPKAGPKSGNLIDFSNSGSGTGSGGAVGRRAGLHDDDLDAELINRNEHNTGRFANDANLAARNIYVPMSFYVSAGNKRGSAVFIPPEILAQAAHASKQSIDSTTTATPQQGSSIDQLRVAGGAVPATPVSAGGGGDNDSANNSANASPALGPRSVTAGSSLSLDGGSGQLEMTDFGAGSSATVSNRASDTSTRNFGRSIMTADRDNTPGGSSGGGVSVDVMTPVDDDDGDADASKYNTMSSASGSDIERNISALFGTASPVAAPPLLAAIPRVAAPVLPAIPTVAAASATATTPAAATPKPGPPPVPRPSVKPPAVSTSPKPAVAATPAPPPPVAAVPRPSVKPVAPPVPRPSIKPSTPIASAVAAPAPASPTPKPVVTPPPPPPVASSSPAASPTAASKPAVKPAPPKPVLPVLPRVPPPRAATTTSTAAAPSSPPGPVAAAGAAAGTKVKPPPPPLPRPSSLRSIPTTTPAAGAGGATKPAPFLRVDSLPGPPPEDE